MGRSSSSLQTLPWWSCQTSAERHGCVASSTASEDVGAVEGGRRRAWGKTAELDSSGAFPGAARVRARAEPRSTSEWRIGSAARRLRRRRRGGAGIAVDAVVEEGELHTPFSPSPAATDSPLDSDVECASSSAARPILANQRTETVFSRRFFSPSSPGHLLATNHFPSFLRPRRFNLRLQLNFLRSLLASLPRRSRLPFPLSTRLSRSLRPLRSRSEAEECCDGRGRGRRGRR